MAYVYGDSDGVQLISCLLPWIWHSTPLSHLDASGSGDDAVARRLMSGRLCVSNSFVIRPTNALCDQRQSARLQMAGTSRRRVQVVSVDVRERVGLLTTSHCKRHGGLHHRFVCEVQACTQLACRMCNWYIAARVHGNIPLCACVLVLLCGRVCEN